MEMQCSSYNKYVIVLACGRGKRMGKDIPKQFLLLNDEPIVITTIKNIHKINKDYKIILVLNKEDVSYWQQLTQKYSFSIPLNIVFGGDERYHSVKNAINSINDCDNSLVAIHDGVRPFINKQMMNDCFSVAEEKGNAVCGIICSDSVRKIDEDKNNSMLDRNKVILIQTPQCFRLSLIKQAYNQPFNPVFTDDASYVENLNERINIVKGRKENIKITLPIDLEIAKVIKEQEDDK